MASIVVGGKYGKLTVVRQWGFKWRAQPCVGDDVFLCVCDCGAQITLPAGRILSTSGIAIAACGECQPDVRLPSVPYKRVRAAGHKVIDELLAEGMSPLRAFFEFKRRTK